MPLLHFQPFLLQGVGWVGVIEEGGPLRKSHPDHLSNEEILVCQMQPCDSNPSSLSHSAVSAWLVRGSLHTATRHLLQPLLRDPLGSLPRWD